MSHQVLFRLIQLTTAATLILIVPSAGSAAGGDNTTTAASHTWGIKNAKTDVRVGADRQQVNGNCSGMVALRQIYLELGLDKKRSLKAATTPASDADRVFLEQDAAMAQAYFFKNRNVQQEFYNRPSDPRMVEKSLADSQPSPDHPQRLILTDEDKRPSGAAFSAHLISVEGRVDQGDKVIYKVWNPNHPDTPSQLVYDKTRGAFQDYEGYGTMRHDNTEIPDQNRRWLEAQARALASGSRYIPYWKNPGDMPGTEHDYLKNVKQQSPSLHIVEPPSPSDKLNKAMAATPESPVGGVRLYFDPSLVSESQAGERVKLLSDLTDQLMAGRESQVVQDGGPEKLQAVRLRALLQQSGRYPTLGGLTRLSGFVWDKANGEIYLLGRREQGRPPISMDVLTVALRLLWQQDAIPAISLDMDPKAPNGPQKVRLEQIPDNLRSTEFVRIMLDADYAMKKIELGVDPLPIPGLDTAYSLFVENPLGHSSFYSLFWLYPKSTAGANIYTGGSDELEMAYVQSDVQVLTESMREAQGLLVSEGKQDPQAVQAASHFTRNFDRIEQLRPVFYRLHGLFDAARLASVLRERKIRSVTLDQVANRTPATVAIPDSYHGIGPQFILGTGSAQGRIFRMSGGIQVASKSSAADEIRPAGLVTLPELRALVSDTGGKSTLNVMLPSSLPLDVEHAQSLRTRMETEQAMDELMSGSPDTALMRIDRVVQQSPFDVPARAVRATARLVTGDGKGALQDAEKVPSSNAGFRAMRGVMRLYAGDRSGALADVNGASAADSSAPVLEQKIMVEILTDNIERAASDLFHLANIAPVDPELDGLRGLVRTLRRLPSDRARFFIRSLLALPPWMGRTLHTADAAASEGHAEAGIQLMEDFLVRGAPLQLRPESYWEERCWMELAKLYLGSNLPEERTHIDEYLGRIAQRHPDWPTPLLVKLEADSEAPRLSLVEAADIFRRASALDGMSDPFLPELEGGLGADPEALDGLNLVIRAYENRASMPQYLASNIPDDNGQIQIIRIPQQGPLTSADLAALRQLAKEVKSRVQPGPARYFLTLIGGITSGTPEDWARFRRSLVAFSDPPPHPDLVTLRALQEIQHILPHTAPLSRRFIGILNTDWSTYEALSSAAATSLQVHGEYSDILTQQMMALPAFKALASKAHTLTPKQAYLAVDRIVLGMLAAYPALTPFSRSFLRSYLRFGAMQTLDRPRSAGTLSPAAQRQQDTDTLLTYMDLDSLEQAAHSLVEIKAAALLYETVSQSLFDESGRNRSASVNLALRSWIRRESALNLAFDAKAGLL